MRCLLAVLALGVVAPGYALDFYSRGARLPALVQKLEAETGKQLRVSPELENDVLYVNVKGVEAEALMELIAKSADAKWRLSGETMTLEPDSARRKRLANEQLEADRREHIEAVEESLKQDIEDETTMELLKLLRALPKSAFGQNYPNRLVFSSNPTRAQYTLRGQAAGLVDAMVKQQNMMAEASQEGQGEMDMMMGFLGSAMDALGIKKEDLMPQPVRTRPAKLLIVMSPSVGSWAFFRNSIEARLFDENGAQIATASMDMRRGDEGIPVPMEEIEEGAAGGDTSTPPPPEDKSPVIEYREESKKILTLQVDFSAASFSTNRVIPEELKQWAYNPYTYEPLSFMASDAWDAWAKHHNKNVVAYLDDNQAWMPTFFEAAPRTMNQFQATLDENYTMAEEGVVTLVAPKNPTETRLNRMNRAAIQGFINSSNANGGVPDLNSWAAYIDSNPIGAEPQGMPMFYEQWAGTDGLIASQMPGHEFSMRLWNRLSANHRASILQGQDLPIRNLGQSATELLTHYVYNEPDSLQPVRPPVTGPNRFLAMMTFGMSGAMGMKRNASLEPTEMFATGLPNNGFIRPFVTSDLLVAPVTPQGESMQMIRALGSDELALFDMITQTPGFASGGSGMPQLNQFRLGTRQLVDFHVMLSPECQLPGSLTLMKVDPKGEIYTRANFPQALKDQISKADAQLKDSGLARFFQMMGAEGAFGGGGEARP
ncbi:MAG: hypothetical protein ACK5UH_11600 [Armatimonadota bacterium]